MAPSTGMSNIDPALISGKGFVEAKARLWLLVDWEGSLYSLRMVPTMSCAPGIFTPVRRETKKPGQDLSAEVGKAPWCVR